MRASNIFVTVDVLVFKRRDSQLELLLIQRKNDPFKGQWALPGGFVDQDEDLNDAAIRELQEETGIKISQVEQLRAFGKPGRDPRHHTVSVAFVAFADPHAKVKAGDDAKAAQWFDVRELPALAFDHAEIVEVALSKIQS